MATWNWKYEHDNNIWSFRLMIILMVAAALLVTLPFFFPELWGPSAGLMPETWTG